MPESKPSSLNVAFGEDWRQTLKDLQKQVNYLFTDVYNYIDNIQGYGGKVFTPENIAPVVISSHTHTSDSEGGDFPWADFIQADVAWVQALRASIQASNVWDKSTSVPAPLLGSAPAAPSSGALLYVIDNVGVKELRVIFANGTDKLIANHT